MDKVWVVAIERHKNDYGDKYQKEVGDTYQVDAKTALRLHAIDVVEIVPVPQPPTPKRTRRKK